MAKADFKGNKKALQQARQKMKGVGNYRQMKDGSVVAAKHPTKKKKSKKR